MSSDSKVQVSVRVRPALAREVHHGVFHGCLACAPTTKSKAKAKANDKTSESGSIYITTSDKPILIDRDDDGRYESKDGFEGVRKFSYDHVFDQSAATDEV